MPTFLKYLALSTWLGILLLTGPVFSATDFSYDGGEALATLPGPHAISSYTKNGARHDLAYDRNGDLESISGSMNTSYTYNTLRKLKEATHSSGEVTKHFYTSTGMRVATIRQSDSNLDIFAEGFLRFTNGNTRFTYGAIEENESGNNFVLKITDHLGSVIASADSTQILNQRDYLPYGQEWISSAAFTDQNFNGHIKQGDLLDYNARHYLPELGKFIQMDSIIPKTDAVGFNRNAYVSNNPINRVDPSGHADLFSAAGEFLGKDGTAYQTFLNTFPEKGHLGFNLDVVAPKNGSRYALDSVDDFFVKRPWSNGEYAGRAMGRIVNGGRTLVFHWDDWRPHRGNGVYRAAHQLAVRSLDSVDEIVMERIGGGNAEALSDGGLKNLPKNKILGRDMGWKLSTNPDGKLRWVKPSRASQIRTFLRDAGQMTRARLNPSHLRATAGATASYYATQASAALSFLGPSLPLLGTQALGVASIFMWMEMDHKTNGMLSEARQYEREAGMIPGKF